MAYLAWYVIGYWERSCTSFQKGEKIISGIRLAHIWKEYKKEVQKVSVFKDLNLFVPENEITVIAGRSGCGKTTLIRTIAGLESADKGRIECADKKIGMVFQEPRLMDWLTVEENIRFGIKNKKTSVQDYIAMTELNDFEQAYPYQLSGGMKQRVALARALAYEPNIILMDEPFAALDYFTKEKLQDNLLNIYEKTSKTIVFITHNIEEAVTLGTRVVTLGDGIVKNIISLEHLSYPRDRDAEEMIEVKRKIREEIGE